MTLGIELLSAFCLLTGGFLCITGGIGLIRMPDFFSRVHAAGVTESLAAPLLLLGLALQMEWSLDLVKVVMILMFILATNPTAGYSMAKAALHGGQRPLVADDDLTDEDDLGDEDDPGDQDDLGDEEDLSDEDDLDEPEDPSSKA